MPRPSRAPSSLRQAARRLRADEVSRVGVQLKLDLRRDERTGIPEVVVAEGKDAQDVRDACRAFLKARGRVLVTRCWSRAPFRGLQARIEFHAKPGVAVLHARGYRRPSTGGRVAVLTGGASDRNVAEEVEIVARELGCEVEVERDAGVAGLGRVLAAVELLARREPHAWVVVAGREGALAPVTAGLVGGPVIGVPVSTGYGHAARGEAALSTMLQSCAPLVAVNIDAGFVAGAVAAQIANRAALLERGRPKVRAPNRLNNKRV